MAFKLFEEDNDANLIEAKDLINQALNLVRFEIASLEGNSSLQHEIDSMLFAKVYAI